MKAIQLKGGAIFVTDGRYTVRLMPDGTCGPSPVLYGVLEWEQAHEPPHTWRYLSRGELQDLPNGGYDKIVAAFADINALLHE
jgi:hypothetical protein